MRSSGSPSWQTLAGGSSPAFLVASALAAAAGLFLLVWVDVLPAADVAPTLAKAALAIAAVALGWRYLSRALVRLPRAAASTAELPDHSLAEMAGFIEAECAGGTPDCRRLVDYIVRQAAMVGASDVHLVPYEDFVAVRFRVDGILQDVAELPVRLRDGVVSRIKVLCKLVTFLRDRPQDGRFEFHHDERRLDVRAALMPTLHGERVVLRLLRRSGTGFKLESLGFTEGQLATLRELLARPQGLIVLTGPAGAGKTTTIYSALNAIVAGSRGSRSVYTLEDPIEYDLLSINQTQVEEARGFTFGQGLRSLLRQDPDVIMVGEIRDLETARIALQAGMTGHLIITTVHARSAVGVFSRLIEMGAEAPSVAAAVTAVMGQRLVRLLCPACKRPQPPGSVAPRPGLHLPEGARLFEPGGCARCGGKGYRGRRAIYEMLVVDEAIARLVSARRPADEVRREAGRRGMKTLDQVGLEMALQGLTSLDEVLRVASG